MSVEILLYEEIDRMFFEHLRLAVVAAGYLPDQTAYTTQQAYETAKETIRNSTNPKKGLIDIFGVGTPESRDEKTTSKIVIDRKPSDRGTLGGAGIFYYEPYMDGSTQKFRKMRMPEESKILNYEIRYSTDSAKYDRIIYSMIENICGYKRYIKTVDSTGAITNKEVFVEIAGEVDLTEGSYIERVLRYRVVDVFMQSAVLITDNIVPMTTVNYGLYAVPQNDIVFE